MLRVKIAAFAVLIIVILTSCSPKPLPPERQRLLAFGASLAEKNNMGYEQIFVGGSSYKKKCREILSDAWQISDGESAKTALDWLRDEGIRAYSDEYFNADEILDIASNPKAAGEESVKLLGERLESYNACIAALKSDYGYDGETLKSITTMAAFDYDRLIALARWCVACKYLSEDEFWSYAGEVAAAARDSYSSWSEYFAAIELGKAVSQGGDIDAEIADKLLKSDESPYKKYAF